MADDQTFFDDIEGYCTPISVAPGEEVALHVSTRASAYDVRIERWGGAREVLTELASLPGRFVEPPDDADSHGCRWPVSARIRVPADAPSGFHLVTLTAHGAPEGRDTTHACFVVRAAPGGDDGADRHGRALLVLGTNTWHAYNTWGGRSLYTGGHRVSHGRPFGRGILSRPEVERDDRKARPTRFRETPDADGEIFQAYRTEHGYPSAIGSTGWFTHERRFVEWAERAGYGIDVAVSSDLADDPSVLDGYPLVLCVGHDEYWSGAQRDAIEAHVGRGGHLATFSGNTMFWQVRLEPGAGPGRHVDMVCHKYRAHLDDPAVADGRTSEMTGMWADPVVGRPEWSLLGAGSAFGLYHRFGQATARGVGGFVVYRDDHWMLAGTDLRYGDVLGVDDGVIGYETLGVPYTLDELGLPVPRERPDLPGDIEIVAITPSSNLAVGEYPKSIAALSDQGDLEFVAERLYGDTGPESRAKVRHGNSVMSTCRPFGVDGGEVVTVGTTDWVFGLADDELVGRVTANVLDRFLGS